MQDRYELAEEVIGQQMCNMYFANDQNRFYAASTSVGSGKTRASVEYMTCAEQASRNFIYVAPTIKLVEQTTQDLKKSLSERGLDTRNINLIHSQCVSSEETASAAALSAVNDSLPNIGATIILTTATFLTILPALRRKDCWHVVLDEAFSPLTFIEYELGKEDREKGREYFDSLFMVDADRNDSVLPASGKHSLVQSVASGDWRQAGTKYQGMQKLSKHVLNDALNVELAKKHEDKYLFASWVTPDYFEDFAEVVFLAALFEQSILHHLWKTMYKVDFKVHAFFEKAIERNVHESQGQVVSVGHILEQNDNASKYNLQRNYITGEKYETRIGMRVIDRAVEIVSAYFLGKKSLLQINKWTGYHTRQKHTLQGNTTVIPTISHGLNDYSQYRAIAALAVTNPSPYQKEWLEKRTGLSENEVYRAFRIHTVYQACGRTAIRDAENSEPVTFITVGKDDAWFLHKLFSGSAWLGQVGDMRRLSKSTENLSGNPRYQALRLNYKRLMTKKSRGGLDDIGNEQLNLIRSEISSLKRDNCSK